MTISGPVREQRSTSSRQTSRSSRLGAGERDRAWGAIQREQAVQAKAPEGAAVAAAIPVVGGIAQSAAADGLHRARALDRGGVHDEQIVIKARAQSCELADQRLDDLGQALAALPETGPLRPLREQVREALGGDREEALVRRDAHDRLRHAQRDDLRVGDPSPGVLGPLGQEIVSGAEHRYEQQVEVGEHRGPLGSTARIGTADFDRCRYVPFPPAQTPQAVELLT
jgi:hypothetical protein